MSDQCRHCTLRGDIEACRAAECFQHENWYAVQQQQEIIRLKARLERQAVDWKSIIDESKIKAQGIEEMAEAIKINDASELDDPYCGGSGYDQALAAATAYADNLRKKDG